jgi:hypothetical protein
MIVLRVFGDGLGKDANRVGATLVVARLPADAVRNAGDRKGRP